ncbi:MAG TPA: BON domain-containing protein [Bryobacteraceae bacterium]|nr:BON domain-containing protein [Bryobacteraceae bacterium]
MFRLLIAIFIAGGLWAQSPRPAVKKNPPAQGTTAQEDKAIEAAIQAKLGKSKIGKDGFKVHVQGGVATWEGSTSILQHKGAATRMAKSAGAKAVVNHIKVSDDAKKGAADNLDSGRRRAQVKRSEPRTEQ